MAFTASCRSQMVPTACLQKATCPRCCRNFLHRIHRKLHSRGSRIQRWEITDRIRKGGIGANPAPWAHASRERNPKGEDFRIPRPRRIESSRNYSRRFIDPSILHTRRIWDWMRLQCDREGTGRLDSLLRSLRFHNEPPDRFRPSHSAILRIPCMRTQKTPSATRTLPGCRLSSRHLADVRNRLAIPAPRTSESSGNTPASAIQSVAMRLQLARS